MPHFRSSLALCEGERRRNGWHARPTALLADDISFGSIAPPPALPRPMASANWRRCPPGQRSCPCVVVLRPSGKLQHRKPPHICQLIDQVRIFDKHPIRTFGAGKGARLHPWRFLECFNQVVLPNRASDSSDLLDGLQRLALLEVDQPRPHRSQPVLQIRPKLQYRRLRCVQLKKYPNRTLYGVALKDVQHIGSGALQERIQPPERCSGKRIR